MAELPDRLVSVSLPGSAYICLFLSHWSWALEDADELGPDERSRVARQLMLLHEAVIQGASPDLDDLVTDQRQLLDIALERLGHVPTDEDRQLVAHCVVRTEDLHGLIRKLLAAA